MCKGEGHPSNMKPDLHIYLSIKFSSLKQSVCTKRFFIINREKNENKLIRSIPFTHPHTSRYDVHLHSFLFFMRGTIFFLDCRLMDKKKKIQRREKIEGKERMGEALFLSNYITLI